MSDPWVTHHFDLAPGAAPGAGAGAAPGAGANLDEWLITNGTGGYAMGSVSGVNARRYHGLLIAATRPPIGRVVLVNQMLERLKLDQRGADETLEFSTCQFRGDDGGDVYAPAGHEMLVRFSKGLYVKWSYRRDRVSFTRELFLHWQQQAVTLRYTVEGLSAAATLQLHPMLTLRDFHDMRSARDAGSFASTAQSDHVTVSREDLSVTLSCDRGRFLTEKDWWRNIYYPLDCERGQDDQEDYYLPGRFDASIGQSAGPQVVVLTAALGDKPVPPQTDCARRRDALDSVLAQTKVGDEPAKRMLVIAADDFVVQREIGGQKLSTILAGYPWFADWGRDTFISLPGLLLATGRLAEARSTLRAFAESIKDGLVPNRFDDYDAAAVHYNTVDASLWFIHAAMEYVHESGDREAWSGWLAQAVTAIIDGYLKGTHYDIAMSSDGLITAGSAQTQLTWMDAAHDGVAFIPRFGKAVEINALWHHALVGCAQLLGEDDAATAGHYNKLAARTKRAFAKVFWDNDAGWLRDHVWTDEQGVDHADDSLRPNQIIAVALAHSPLPRTKQRRVIDAVGRHLLTPYGLRTLAVDDVNYHGQYTGGPWQRDQAYHQGTVWPWLIGPYAEAILRAGRFKPEDRDQARSVLEPLLTHMRRSGLGQLHEIHEGDPPHRPVGCMAQAWSVAQVLRVLHLLASGDSCDQANG